MESEHDYKALEDLPILDLINIIRNQDQTINFYRHQRSMEKRRFIDACAKEIIASMKDLMYEKISNYWNKKFEKQDV